MCVYFFSFVSSNILAQPYRLRSTTGRNDRISFKMKIYHRTRCRIFRSSRFQSTKITLVFDLNSIRSAISSANQPLLLFRRTAKHRQSNQCFSQTGQDITPSPLPQPLLVFLFSSILTNCLFGWEKWPKSRISEKHISEV